MKRTLLALAASCALLHGANASLVFSIQQDGENVTMTGIGSINLDALSTSSPSAAYSIIRANDSLLGVGIVDGNLQHYTSITGPGSIGPGSSLYFADSTSGDNVMMNNNSVSVPIGYTSGTELSGTATFNNNTIAGMGLTEGTYTYTWGSGASADSITVQVGAIPEPATFAFIGLFGVGAIAIRRIFMM